MTVLVPCNTCWFRSNGACAERIFWRAKTAVTGGFTSVRFVCERQKVEYRPGRRVTALIRGADHGSYDDDGPANVKVKATVIQKSSKRDRWVVWPDDDQWERLPHVGSRLKLCALRSEMLEPLDEPDRPERIAELKAIEDEESARAIAEFV